MTARESPVIGRIQGERLSHACNPRCMLTNRPTAKEMTAKPSNKSMILCQRYTSWDSGMYRIPVYSI